MPIGCVLDRILFLQKKPDNSYPEAGNFIGLFIILDR